MEDIILDETFGSQASKIVTTIKKVLGDILKDERVSKILVGYDSFLNGNTIALATKRCELYRAPNLLDDNLENLEQVATALKQSWLSLPTEPYWKEQATGLFRKIGKIISFNRVFGSYRFSDEEVERLLNGEVITFPQLNGRTMSGDLQEQEYKGFRYFGLKLKNTIPNIISDVALSPYQIQQLEAGKEIYVQGLYSKVKSRHYNAFIRWNKELEKIEFVRFV